MILILCKQEFSKIVRKWEDLTLSSMGDISRVNLILILDIRER